MVTLLRKLFLFFLGSVWISNVIAADKEIVVQLKWRHQFQFAGFYAAQIKGFYKEAGLDVKLLPGGPDVSPIAEVIGGNADVGIFDPGVILRSPRSNPLIILAPIMQSSPYGIISLKEKRIISPEDLIGKKVLAERDQGLSVFNAVLFKAGVNPADIEFAPRSLSSEDILNKDVDAVVTYLTSQLQRYEALGIDINIIRPEEYGVDFYGDLIFSTKHFTEENQDHAKAFVNASLKGWEYALDHPEEMMDYILTLPEVSAYTNRTFLREEYRQVRSLMMPDLVEIGQSNYGRWQYILNFYKRMGLIDQDMKVGDFLFKVSDDSFEDWILPGLYLLFFISIAVLIIIGLNWRLRQQVRKRTEELQAEIENRIAAENRARQNEEKLQLAISNANIGVWEYDMSSGESYLSDNWWRLLGYDTAFTETASLLDLVHPDDLEETKKTFQREEDLEGRNMQHCRLIKQNGASMHVLISLRKVRGEDPKASRFFGVVINIDELKTKEDELFKLSEELIRSNTELKKFAYITSHNLRGPVVNISSLTQMIDKEVLPEEERLIFEKLEFSVKRLNDTLNDLIEVVSYQESKQHQSETVSFEETLNGVIKSIEHQVVASNASIETLFQVKEVYFPKLYLESVLQNLMTNAIKYRSPDRKLIIQLQTLINENGNVTLIVSDNGMGIDLQKNSSKLFGLYQRFHENIEGKGLGLFIVKSHIESQKGSIEVESEEGRGTRFIITFSEP